MDIEVRASPAITRVHSLHRIRTVVNHVEELVKAKVAEIDDIAIANHLISTHLSKPTTNHFRDQIGRRARDHLETARYLGLLYRLKSARKYRHVATIQGKALSSYQFEEQCPKDYREEAILIDKICRMKMTNASYMQTPHGYEGFRSRICLNALSALEICQCPLSTFQIGYILGEMILDPFTHMKKLEGLSDFVTSKRFIENYRPSDDEKRNIKRDTDPFLDWLAQLDLVRRQDEHFLEITKRGKKVASHYSSMLPLWYCDLGAMPSVPAAALLLINFFKLTKEHDAIESLLILKTRWGLFNIQVNKSLVRALGKHYGGIINGDTIADFTFYYDVPPEDFEDVKVAMEDLLHKIGHPKVTSEAIIRFLEAHDWKTLLPEFKTEANELGDQLAEKEKIKIKVKAAAIYQQFRSPYEADTYNLFSAIEAQDFKVQKYQSQLEQFFLDNKRWESFAKNNPDLLTINDFIGLVECKSVGEWGDFLTLRKGILNEITNYNLFCEEVKSIGLKRHVAVVFSYEGRIRDEEFDEIDNLINKEFPNVIIITRGALQKSLTDISFRNKLREAIKTKGVKHKIIVP